nr:MAG TPA: hypothetical protein [Caudoviricetes sp.]
MVNFHSAERMKINENTSVVDVALNLSGSLAGLPVVVEQLPVGEPVGFDAMPAPGEDVEDIGQTWTPDLQGKEVDLDVPVYNPSAQQKEPYTTNMSEITPVIAEGEEMINGLLSGEDGRKIIRVSDLPVGFNLRGCKIHFTMTHLRPTAKKGQQNIWYGITAAWDKGVTYKGSLLRHYTDKIAKPNTLTFFTEYYINIDVSRNAQIVYMDDDDGWQTDVIEFSIEHDCIVTSNTCNLESFEPGAWNWNYAYVEAYQFPKVKKSVADIPVGYNLRNKTIYFHGTELQRDDNAVGNVLEATTGDGKTHAIVDYRARAERSFGITVEIYGQFRDIYYSDYSGKFLKSKYTFPDIDIIVTKNELSKIRSKGFFWGFDYAEISDDSTLPAPSVLPSNLVRPYFRYLNAIPCNLDNWIPWRAGETLPTIQPEKWIRFTTNGQANSLNGGGVFNVLLFNRTTGPENIVLDGNIVIIRAIARTQGPPEIRFSICLPSDNQISTIGKTFTEKFTLFEGQLTYNVATSANSVLIAKGYGDATPGTYDVQAIEVLVYKLPPNGNKSK